MTSGRSLPRSTCSFRRARSSGPRRRLLLSLSSNQSTEPPSCGGTSEVNRELSVYMDERGRRTSQRRVAQPRSSWGGRRRVILPLCDLVEQAPLVASREGTASVTSGQAARELMPSWEWVDKESGLARVNEGRGCRYAVGSSPRESSVREIGGHSVYSLLAILLVLTGGLIYVCNTDEAVQQAMIAAAVAGLQWVDKLGIHTRSKLFKPKSSFAFTDSSESEEAPAEGSKGDAMPESIVPESQEASPVWRTPFAVGTNSSEDAATVMPALHNLSQISTEGRPDHTFD
eukprot:scaffold1658_cov393-Prasinococcus_capsulatus_cf.AAC.20